MSYYQIFQKEEGQGLVEYALVLVLVGLVIIAALSLFGTSLKDTFCRITYQVAPGSDISSACVRPIVMPRGLGQGANFINVEAVIHDPDGNPNSPYAAITKVEFFIDSTGSGPVRTEFQYKYCLGGGNTCQNQNISGLSSGKHTVIILAHDSSGNVGRGTYTFTK